MSITTVGPARKMIIDIMLVYWFWAVFGFFRHDGRADEFERRRGAKRQQRNGPIFEGTKLLIRGIN